MTSLSTDISATRSFSQSAPGFLKQFVNGVLKSLRISGALCTFPWRPGSGETTPPGSCDPLCPSIVRLKPGFSGGPDDGGWTPSGFETKPGARCGSGRHTRATLGEKTTGCDGRLSLTRGLWRVRRPCFGPVTVPSWSGSCGCGCVGRPWRHATSPPNTMLRSTPSAARSTASRNHSTFPCAPAAAPGPHRVEATPPKHVHIPEHVHILGRGIRRML